MTKIEDPCDRYGEDFNAEHQRELDTDRALGKDPEERTYRDDQLVRYYTERCAPG